MREWYDSGECAARKWRVCGERMGSVWYGNLLCGESWEFVVC